MDLSAAVLAARRPEDRYFCFEQPDRDGFAIAALGAVEVVEARGPGRFEAVAARCRQITHAIEGDERGPIWVGGFAFSPDGGMTPEWSSLAPAQLTMPEVALARSRGGAWMTVTALTGPGVDAGALLDRLQERLATLRPAAMPLLDPDPVEATRVASAAAPQHFESAVARAVERISAGELTKVVLARE